MRVWALLSSMVLLAGCVSAPGPTSQPFSSTTESIEAALVSGCLPYLVEGGSIYDRLRDANTARGGKLNGKRAARLYGSGDVQIQETDTGGCYLRVVGAMSNTGVPDAARFRQAALDILTSAAGPLQLRSDSGPGFNDPIGKNRQESYCVTLRGRPAWLVISTSSAVMTKAILQVSMGWDSENICKGDGPAEAPARSI